MKKSTRTEAQSAQVLAAALALGMTLGMVGAASADPQNKSSDIPKLDGASKDAAQDKMSGQVTQKGSETIKMNGGVVIKGQQTIKLDATTGQKVSGLVTEKVPNSAH